MSDPSFPAFRTTLTQANQAVIQGDATRIKQIYSQRDDVTLLGGFGGIERGWTQVAPRLDWAASQFSRGTFAEEDISVVVGSELAYTVTIERNQVDTGNPPEPQTLELRVTQIFRREPDGWRLVHRHADPFVQKRSP
ncbi:MAG: nuclear transport factor 2 family protein [Gloeomargarita sp. HHBFW_bins_162]